MLPVHPTDNITPSPQPPYPCQAKAALASAQRLPTGRLTPLPLSQREQQVCECLSQGVSIEAIANRLNFSPAAAKEYYRRALDKHQRTIALATAPLKQGDRSIPATIPGSSRSSRARSAISLAPAHR